MPSPQNSGYDPGIAAIGRIRKPVGLKGMCYVSAFGSALETLPLPCEVIIDRQGTGRFSVILETIFRNPKGFSCKFKGFDDREQTEKLRDGLILIREKELPQLPENEYYHFELEGMQVIGATGNKYVGTIKEVLNFPTTDALEIIKSDNSTAIIPLNKEAVKKIDKDNRKILVDNSLLEDLL
ncbi:MAG: 16S rRNA processing protein RimM [Chitinivibrionales bacterium]|nr:16S rRNA processing protein RimM [Chitinivibrionales bacterium]